MITSFEIENFKVFSRRQRINIKPITLIYGPNSAGKSSIIQSYLFLQNYITQKSLTPNIITNNGSTIDIGDYNQYISNQNSDNDINFNITSEGRFQLPLRMRQGRSNISKIDITLSVNKNNEIKHMSLILDNELTFFWDGINTNINFQHKLFKSYVDEIKIGEDILNDIKNIKFIIINRNISTRVDRRQLPYFLTSRIVALHDSISDDDLRFSDKYKSNDNPIIEMLDYLNFLTTSFISDRFFDERNIHIKSLRDLPERHELLSNNMNLNKVYRELMKSEAKRKKINDWLTNNSKINSPYEFRIGEFKSSTKRRIQILELYDNKENVYVSLKDIGVGVSQIIPILLHSLSDKDRTISIEQPELHLHPKIQCELADLFIESTNSQNNNFLIETHSEHLLLRFMKRIRQTTENELPNEFHKFTPNDIAVLYVDPSEEGSIVKELRLDEDGDFIDPWPDGFFEEGYKERFF